MKRLFLIAGLIFTLGLITTIIFGLIARDELDAFSGDDSFSKVSTSYLQADVDNISKITIDIHNRNLYVLPSQNDEIIVEYYNTKYGVIHETKETTQLNYKENLIWHFGFSFGFDWIKGIFNPEYNHFYLYLPNYKAFDLDVTTSNGRLEIKNVKLDEFKGRTSNGKIVLEDLTTNKINATTSNGSIIVSKINSEDEIILNTSNGRITAEKINAPYLNCDTSNGRITVRMEGKLAEYFVSMSTTNGDYFLNGAKSRNAEINSSSLAKKVILDTSNGDVSIYFSE